MIDHHHHRWNTESIANCISTLEIPHKSCNDPHYSTNLHRGSALLYSSAWKRTWSITQPRNSITNHWHDSSEAEQSHGLLKRNSTNERTSDLVGPSKQASCRPLRNPSTIDWPPTRYFIAAHGFDLWSAWKCYGHFCHCESSSILLLLLLHLQLFTCETTNAFFN